MKNNHFRMTLTCFADLGLQGIFLIPAAQALGPSSHSYICLPVERWPKAGF